MLYNQRANSGSGSLHFVILLTFTFISTVFLHCKRENPSTQTQETEASAGKAFVISKVSDNPLKKIVEYQPLADYLAANLNNYGFTVGEIKVTLQLDDMIPLLNAGKIDLFIDDIVHCPIAADRTGAEPIALRLKEGDYYKSSVFFIRTGSRIQTVDDLKGKLIAMDSPDSISGYMIPISYLIKSGHLPVEKTESNVLVNPKNTGYIFTHDDDSTVLWVITNKVDAGVVDNRTYEAFVSANPNVFQKIHESEKILRHDIVLARPDMDTALKDTVKKLLLEIDSSEYRDDILGPSRTLRFEEKTDIIQQPKERMLRIYESILAFQNR